MQAMQTPLGPQGFDDVVRYEKAPERSSIGDTADVVDLVTEILKAVRTRGDDAVREYSRRFDKAELDSFEITAVDPQRGR